MIDQKLFEREEVSTLLSNQLLRTIPGTAADVIWIRGEAGTGKTSLVRSVRQQLIDNGYWFLSVKFDQYNQVPYRTINELHDQIIKKCKTSISAHGDSGKEVWIANLEKAEYISEYLKSQHSEDADRRSFLSPRDYEVIRVRLRHLYSGLTRYIPRLFLFFDDIQWGEDASIELVSILRNLIVREKLSKITLIGAVRSESKLSARQDKLLRIEKKYQEKQIEFHLDNLSRQGVVDYLADTLSIEDKHLHVIADICYNKTYGNPFWVQNFLEEATALDLLGEDMSSLTWSVREASLQQFPARQNVMDLLKRKLDKLPESDRYLTGVTAAVGYRGEVELIEQLVARIGYSKYEKLDLTSPVEEGILQVYQNHSSDRIESYYVFAHDEVYKACNALLSQDERPKVHFQIAEIFEQRYLKRNADSDLFQLLQHYYLTGDLLIGETKEKVIGYAYRGGQIAQDLSDYSRALIHFQKVYDLLESSDGSNDSGIDRWRLLNDLVTMAFLCGKLQTIERMVEKIEQASVPFSKMLPIYEQQIHALLSHEQYDAASDKCLSLLGKHFGIMIPRRMNLNDWKTQFIIGLELVVLIWKTRNFSTSRLRSLSPSVDPATTSLMSLLTLASMSIFNTDVGGFIFVVVEGIKQSLQRGSNEFTPPFFAALGLILCQLPVPMIPSGVRLAKMTETSLDQGEKVAYRFHAAHVVHGLVKFWSTPLRSTLPDLKRWLDSSIRSYHLNAASHLLYSWVIHSYYAGKEVREIKANIEKYRAKSLFESAELSDVRNPYLDLLEQVLSNLITRDHHDELTNLDGKYFNPDTDLISYIEDKTLWTSYYFFKLQIHCLVEEYDEANSWARKLAGYEEGRVGMLFPQQCFYVAYSTLIGKLQKGDKLSIPERKLVRQCRRKLNHYSKYCPANFLHQYLIIQGLYQIIRGLKGKADNSLTQALELSQEHGFSQDAALAWRALVYLALANNREEFATTARQRSEELLNKWRGRKVISPNNFIPNTSFLNLSEKGFSDTDKVFNKLLHWIKNSEHTDVILNHATTLLVQLTAAHRFVFLIEVHQHWCVIYDTVDQQPKQIRLEKDDTLPREIITYTIETRAIQRLDNASREGEFTAISYVKKQGAKSILSIPLVITGQLEGILYAEQLERESFFNQQQVELLEAVGVIVVNLVKTNQEKNRIDVEITAKTKKISEQSERIQILHNELTHRYGNNLGKIRAYLSGSARKTDSSAAIRESISRLDALISLHKFLILKDGPQIEMFEYLPGIVKSVLEVQGVPVYGTMDLIDVDEINLSTGVAGKIGFLVHELCINSCKYAFVDHPHPKFRVALNPASAEPGHYRLVVSDNGPGYPIATTEEITSRGRKSLGMDIVRNLCREIAPQTPPVFTNRNGAYFEFTFYDK